MVKHKIKHHRLSSKKSYILALEGVVGPVAGQFGTILGLCVANLGGCWTHNSANAGITNIFQ